MSEEVREYTDLYNKYLKDGKYSLLNLMIIDEIQCQLEDEISDEDYNDIFYIVKHCYLKSSDVDLWCLVNYCLKNKDTIRDMESWFIINHSQILR